MRVLIADHLSLFREAVKAVLEHEPDIEVVAEAQDGHEAVSKAERLEPHVAILEPNLPALDGITCTHMIRQRVPSCRVIVLSPAEDLRELVQAVEAGASGYLTKAAPIEELLEAARAVDRGETIVPRLMLSGLLAELSGRRRAREEAFRQLSKLTAREKEVLALLAQGADNRAIAERLVISPQTARTHVHNVLGKLGIHSRLKAVAFVNRGGLLGHLTEEGPAVAGHPGSGRLAG